VGQRSPTAVGDHFDHRRSSGLEPVLAQPGAQSMRECHGRWYGPPIGLIQPTSVQGKEGMEPSSHLKTVHRAAAVGARTTGERAMTRRVADAGDDGTNDLIVSEVIRRNELQVWFVAEHVVSVPMVELTKVETSRDSRAS
jgi:hypothetical protein